MFKIQYFSKFRSEQEKREIWVDLSARRFDSVEDAEKSIEIDLIQRQQWVNDKFRVVAA